MFKTKSIVTGTLIDRKDSSVINLGRLYNVQKSYDLTTPLAKVSPAEVRREVERLKAQKREELKRAVAEKVERDKAKLHATLSEEAIFSITYVPFVIAEVAWDYADTLLDLAVIMKLHATKKLCRAIKELRREYDRNRFRIINDSWRKSETENMLMFEEVLSDYFGKVYKSYKEALQQTYNDLNTESVELIATVYECLTVIDALQRYCQAQEKVVASILGYEIATIVPDEIRRLKLLVAEFAGDCRLPDSYKDMRKQFADELAEYINDTELNDTDKEQEKKKSTKKTSSNSNNSKQQTTMTNEALFNEVKAVIATLTSNMEMNVSGNNAAGLRARKASLQLEKLLKLYRKQSIEAAKK